MRNLTLIPIPALKDNYIWALVDSATHRVLIVDPGEAAPVIAFLQKNKLTLVGILITHHHGDHTQGVSELTNLFDMPVFGPASESVKHMTHPLREGDSVQIPDFPLTLQVIDIPGHTVGHIAYYSHGMLFCGDTLFAAGCGRPFEGTPHQLFSSLQKLASYPDETKVYCAHEYTLNNLRFAELVEPGNQQIEKRMQQVFALRKQHQPSLPSTMGEEKATNPFLRCDSPEVIKSVEEYAGKKLETTVEVFTWLRKWKDNF